MHQPVGLEIKVEFGHKQLASWNVKRRLQQTVLLMASELWKYLSKESIKWHSNRQPAFQNIFPPPWWVGCVLFSFAAGLNVFLFFFSARSDLKINKADCRPVSGSRVGIWRPRNDRLLLNWRSVSSHCPLPQSHHYSTSVQISDQNYLHVLFLFGLNDSLNKGNYSQNSFNLNICRLICIFDAFQNPFK